MLVKGQLIADKILAKAKAECKKLAKRGLVPKLVVVLVGEDKASEVYVRRKQEAAKAAGLVFVLHRFSASISKQKLIAKLKSIQADKKLSGLIIQLPLPENLYQREVMNAVEPRFDVDFLNDLSLGALTTRSNKLEPPTASAMLEIPRNLKISFASKRVAVVGAGVLVGRPLVMMLLNEGATVTACNSQTRNLNKILQECDIVFTCVGKPNLIRGKMLKPGCVVVDAGFAFKNGRGVGDVEIKSVLRVAKAVTPTPGGVGPITVAKLISNTVALASHVKK